MIKYGKKWSAISKYLGNSRTENAVKNRFNSLIKKDKEILKQLSLKEPVTEELQSLPEDITYEEYQIMRFL